MKILFFGDSITDMSRNRNENAEEIYTYGSGYPMLVASAYVAFDSCIQINTSILICSSL